MSGFRDHNGDLALSLQKVFSQLRETMHEAQHLMELYERQVDLERAVQQEEFSQAAATEFEGGNGGFDTRNVGYHQVGDELSRNRSRSPRGVRQDAHPAGAIESAIESRMVDLRLDDETRRAVLQFSPEMSVAILDMVGSSVRTPSVFVSSLCEKVAMSLDGGFPSDMDRVEALVNDLHLDESATRAIQTMTPTQALEFLNKIDRNVRNPSAFIIHMVGRTGKKGDKGGGKGGHPGSAGANHEDPRDAHRVDHTRDTHRVDRGAQEGIAGTINDLAKQLNLDDTCIDALHSCEPQSAVNILGALAQDLDSIRNRSAFVIAEVKRRRSEPPVNRPRVGASGSAAGGVPCKFFTEGRCKNGESCRFSHYN